MMADGYGFLRSSDYNYLLHLMIFIYRLLKLDFWFKTGDTVKVVRLQRRREIFPLVRVLKINGHDPQVVRDRVI
jgi:transcription termination factor Rho